MAAAYKVTRYDCATQLAAITALAALADSQQAGDPKPFDSRVLPWIHGCDKSHKTVRHIRHYVAQKADGTIVGWLLAETRRRFSHTYVYLSEISVIRIKSDEHKGIGKALHSELLVDAGKDRAAFIYLYPLTDAAKATYAGWGYKTPKEMNERDNRYPDIKHQFLLDPSQTIPDRLLSKLKPEHASRPFIDAGAIVGGDDTDPLRRLINKASRERKDDSTFVNKVREAVETIAVFGVPGDEGEDVLSREEQLEMIRDVVKEPAGGRRRTRRLRRVRKTRRSLIKKRAYT